MAAGPIPCAAPGPSVSGGHPAVARQARAPVVCHGCREWAGQRLGQEGGRRESQQDLWPGTGRAAAQPQHGPGRCRRWESQPKSSTREKEGQPWLRILLTFFTAAFSRVTSCAPSWPCAQIAKAAGGRICLGSCQAALFPLKSFKASEGEKRV